MSAPVVFIPEAQPDSLVDEQEVADGVQIEVTLPTMQRSEMSSQ